jgi:quercetin dioxygenase-like cupin family protein
MTRVISINDAGSFEIAPGVRMSPLFGDSSMFMVVTLEPNAVVPAHSHPHEQLGLVLAGTITFRIGGAEHTLGVDGAYHIPGGVEHGAVAGPEGCRVIDIFQPVREDYRKLVEGEPR